MTVAEKREMIDRAIADGYFCSVIDYYETTVRYLLPLKSSDEYYLSLQEDNMSFDGYILERFTSIDRVIVSGEKSLRFAEEAGVLDNLKIPDVDINTPANFFAWLVAEGCPVYLECGEPDSRKVNFFMGRVENCNQEGALVRCFSLDAIFENRPIFLIYNSIIRVCFGTDALNRFEQMLNRRRNK